MGASLVLDGGEHYLWDVQLADLLDTDTPDLRRMDGDAELWAARLPRDAPRTSVLTVADRHLIGTVTRLTDSGQRLLSIELPATAVSAMVLVDRETGEVVFEAPVPDDSTSTVTIGPDGAAYVTMLGLVSGFALETQITGGVVKFEPAHDGVDRNHVQGHGSTGRHAQ